MLIRLLRKNKRGESILETVIAMAILAIGISIVSTIIGSSIRNINASKNRIIAIGIAREGLEAMRNIRDTNWLKFNSKKRECWNHNPGQLVLGQLVADTCDGLTPIQPGRYIIYKEVIMDTSIPPKIIGWKWRLENLVKNPSGDSFPLSPTPNTGDIFYKIGVNIAYAWNGTEWVELAQLYLIDVDPLVDSDKDGDKAIDPENNKYKTNDSDMYNHALVEGDNALGKDYAIKSPFKRILTIYYLENDGDKITDPNDMSDDHNRMRIRSEVEWQEGKFKFKTDLATTLTDYQGRENLNN